MVQHPQSHVKQTHFGSIFLFRSTYLVLSFPCVSDVLEASAMWLHSGASWDLVLFRMAELYVLFSVLMTRVVPASAELCHLETGLRGSVQCTSGFLWRRKVGEDRGPWLKWSGLCFHLLASPVPMRNAPSSLCKSFVPTCLLLRNWSVGYHSTHQLL